VGVLGGEVLKAKRLRVSTEIEVLQLPLDGEEKPSRDRQPSQRRFLALQQEFLDSATVGEVAGAKTHHLDDMEVRYPMLILKQLHAWPVQSYAYGTRQPRPSIGVFGGMGIDGGARRGGGGFGLGF
jgi:outer membrane lipoprotein